VSGPLVSVLVPTYNGAAWLEATLRSASEQTHRDLEILVGDDASTDATPQVLAAAAARDPRIRVIRHERNVGAFDNPARLLEAARGEYVKFLLHDDLLHPRCVEVLLAGLRSSGRVRLAFSHRAVVDEHGEPVPGREVGHLTTNSGAIDGRELGDVVLENCANVIGELTTVLFRRRDVPVADLWRVDGRPLAANGDVALWLGLLARGDAWYTPETLSSFRSHGAQRTQDPRVLARGTRDWPSLIDWGRRQGFLRDPARERRAHALILQTAAAVHAAVQDQPLGTALLEAVFLSTARLLELHVGATPRGPLADRARTALSGRFGQELDVWAGARDIAVAAPAADAAEVTATVAALREVQRAGAARALVLAVPPADVPRVVPLVEAALAGGPDLDVDLVPAEDPATAFGGEWLAVVPRGGTWPRERADAVWSFAVPAAGG
jgi:glycosyltransferase involved in cell wall biosynthesis